MCGINLTVQQARQIQVSWSRVGTTNLDTRRRKLRLSDSSAGQSHFFSVRLFKASANGLCLKAGKSWIVRLLLSNKQKVTSLKNWIVWPSYWICVSKSGTNYVGCVNWACWFAFEGPRRWFTTFVLIAETTSLLGRWSGDAELRAASSCCFRLELAKRNLKLTPEVKLSSVI